MADTQTSFTLRPITTADIPACAHVAGVSFELDRHTQLKARSPTNPYNHEEGMKGALAHWIGRPPGAVETALAADDSTGEILGWVAWGFRGFNSQAAESQREEELRKLAESNPERGDCAAKAAEPSDAAKAGTQHDGDGDDKDDTRSSRERLESYTGSDMAVWMERLMPPGTRCMFICSIVVHPAHQGKGVGSALIRKGTDRADAERVYCWVHASEAGAGMFERQGFREVGRLELDLDRWNSENVVPPEGPEASWGTYTFRYMRREVDAN